MNARERALVLQAQLHELLAENATLKLATATLENAALKAKVAELEAAAVARDGGAPPDPPVEPQP